MLLHSDFTFVLLRISYSEQSNPVHQVAYGKDSSSQWKLQMAHYAASEAFEASQEGHSFTRYWIRLFVAHGQC